MLFSFGNLNNQKFIVFINNDNKKSKFSNDSLILKSPLDFALLFNQSNNTIRESNSDPENVLQSKYYDNDESQQLKNLNTEEALSFFILINAH